MICRWDAIFSMHPFFFTKPVGSLTNYKQQRKRKKKLMMNSQKTRPKRAWLVIWEPVTKHRLHLLTPSRLIEILPSDWMTQKVITKTKCILIVSYRCHSLLLLSLFKLFKTNCTKSVLYRKSSRMCSCHAIPLTAVEKRISCDFYSIKSYKSASNNVNPCSSDYLLSRTIRPTSYSSLATSNWADSEYGAQSRSVIDFCLYFRVALEWL